MTGDEARSKLVVPLDFETVEQAERCVETLGKSVDFYKVGYQLAFAGGLTLCSDLLSMGKQVFLDMKLLDIDNTVHHAVENIARMGVTMTTIHAYPKAMRAAVAAAKGSPLTLLGVTVLTSMDDNDLSEAGYLAGADALVKSRAIDAAEAGMGGIVCSAREAGMVRDVIGGDLAIVTPGIRPRGADYGDQKRVMTPAEAITAGATHLVVGRPVTGAPDPAAAARNIISEIASNG